MTGLDHEAAGYDAAGHNASEHDASEHEAAEHDGFDCSLARLQLYEYLDGEMDVHDCAKIREHLAHCGPCLREYDIDQMLKALVRRSCGCETAPAQLRMQILSRITTITLSFE